MLESAQAGLSWRTILGRREGYRAAFSHFDPYKVAKFTDKHVEQLLTDTRIIRNRAKIEAAVNNAKRFLEVQDEYDGSFSAYIWSFVGGESVQNTWQCDADVPATTRGSEELARDLKTRGFRFLGPTIMYAHMQATGMVNDHVIDCFRHEEMQDMRRAK